MYLFTTTWGLLALMCGTTVFAFGWVLALVAIAQHNSYNKRPSNGFPYSDYG